MVDLSPRVTEALRRWRRTAGTRWDPALTPRQREMLRLYCHDMTFAEIAAELGLSPRTVQYTIHAAFVRLGLGGGQSSPKGTACWCVGFDDGPV